MAFCRLFIVVLFLAAAVPASGGDTITARYIRTIDGDTFVADIIYPGGVALADVSIRIAGIDTPELRDKKPEMRERAKQARDFARTMLESAKCIELREVERGKYFRIVARVLADGQEVAQGLVKG